jgi:NAD(P)-dependent dehydrogenase (short-subunit alcohol dehydrogenase family)
MVSSVVAASGKKVTVPFPEASPAVANFSHLDVRNSAQVAELVRNSHPATGGLDVLVYCAGVFDNMVGCLETSEALWTWFRRRRTPRASVYWDWADVG